MRPVILLPVLGLAAVGCISLAPAVESIGGNAPPRAARSVHWQWVAPPAGAFYLEMVVERSTPGSYFMACGWDGGYFGIQELANGRKVALFSVWDTATGDDPNAVRPEDRVEVLHEGAGVRIRRFGGEGTGGQCMLDWPWEIGRTNRFLVRAHSAAGKTAFAGYLFDPTKQAWQHLVTFRRRGEGGLRGLNSFVEDFRRDGRSVHEVRRARYLNGWVQTFADGWRPLDRARFTASGASWEARDNINAFVDAAGAWLITGGDTRRQTELRALLTGIPTAAAPPADLPAPPH